jgi:hypothetical protein
MWKYFLVALWMLGIMGCDGQDPSLLKLQLRLIPLQNRTPLSSDAGTTLPLPWNGQKRVLESYRFSAYAKMVYLYGGSDSVSVTILEFADDLSALGFQLNGGFTREGLPVVKGDVQERCIRAGRRLFLFASAVFRPLPAALAEQFVKSFPGYRAGLPQEFLALPIKNRVSGGTSLQLHSFLGETVAFPVLVQRYGDPSGYWQCARSWTRVSTGEWKALLQNLSRTSVVRTVGAGTVACNGSSCAWLDRLPDGRVVAAFGDVDLQRLTALFLLARQSVEDASL